MLTRPLLPPLPKGGRSGSTLTEVLVALMITSIGLVSVATLFPLSVLRAVKATQLTSATDSRFNAEAMIDLYPNIIKSPGVNPINPAVVTVPTNFPTTANLATNDPSLTQNYIVDPMGFWAIQNLNVAPSGTGLPYQQRPEHWHGNDPSWSITLETPPVLPGSIPWAARTDSLVIL